MRQGGSSRVSLRKWASRAINSYTGRGAEAVPRVQQEQRHQSGYRPGYRESPVIAADDCHLD